MDASLAGEILAALGGMATTGRAVIDMVKSAKGSVKDAEASERLESALAEMKSLNSEFLATEEKVRALNREVLRLDEENSTLRRQERELREAISRKEEWSAERQKYQLANVGKAKVLTHPDFPGTYFCPTCFQVKEKAIPLQPTPQIPELRAVGFTYTHKCAACPLKVDLGE